MLKLTYRRPSFMGFLLLVACAVLAQGVLSMATDQSYADNDNPVDKDSGLLTLHKRPAFFVGSRYGRSSSNSGASGSSKARRLIIVPRNDRFFLGSRYGKRGVDLLSPYEQNILSFGKGISPQKAEQHNNAGSAGRVTSTSTMLSCIYTGISNFYRCNNGDELNNIMNQLTGAGTESALEAGGMDEEDNN